MDLTRIPSVRLALATNATVEAKYSGCHCGLQGSYTWLDVTPVSFSISIRISCIGPRHHINPTRAVTNPITLVDSKASMWQSRYVIVLEPDVCLILRSARRVTTLAQNWVAFVMRVRKPWNYYYALWYAHLPKPMQVRITPTPIDWIAWEVSTHDPGFSVPEGKYLFKGSVIVIMQ